MSQAHFKLLMRLLDATPDPKASNTFTLTVQGHRLHLKYFPDRGDPWVAARWLCGDEQARAAWLAAPDDRGQADALYSVYRNTAEAERAAIRSKGLPHNNPYSLKWNHYGPDCVEQLRAGLRPYFKQLEA